MKNHPSNPRSLPSTRKFVGRIDGFLINHCRDFVGNLLQPGPQEYLGAASQSGQQLLSPHFLHYVYWPLGSHLGCFTSHRVDPVDHIIISCHILISSYVGFDWNPPIFQGNYTPLFHGFIRFYPTFLALLIMMTASAVIAALDDKRRHEADVHTNNQSPGFSLQNVLKKLDLFGGISGENIRYIHVYPGHTFVSILVEIYRPLSPTMYSMCR
jgi:hypothetical protein